MSLLRVAKGTSVCPVGHLAICLDKIITSENISNELILLHPLIQITGYVSLLLQKPITAKKILALNKDHVKCRLSISGDMYLIEFIC